MPHSATQGHTRQLSGRQPLLVLLPQRLLSVWLTTPSCQQPDPACGAVAQDGKAACTRQHCQRKHEPGKPCGTPMRACGYCCCCQHGIKWVLPNCCCEWCLLAGAPDAIDVAHGQVHLQGSWAGSSSTAARLAGLCVLLVLSHGWKHATKVKLQSHNTCQVGHTQAPQHHAALRLQYSRLTQHGCHKGAMLPAPSPSGSGTRSGQGAACRCRSTCCRAAATSLEAGGFGRPSCKPRALPARTCPRK